MDAQNLGVKGEPFSLQFILWPSLMDYVKEALLVVYLEIILHNLKVEQQ